MVKIKIKLDQVFYSWDPPANESPNLNAVNLVGVKIEFLYSFLRVSG